jgi:hypothetical protein
VGYNTSSKNLLWKTISPWLNKKHYAFTTVMFLISIFVFSLYFTKPKIKSENDLLKVQGKLSYYSFEKGARGAYYYYIWLSNYESELQIPAKYVDYFDKLKFETRAHNIKILQLKIAKEQSNQLNNPYKKIFLYGIDAGEVNFLNSKQTLEYESHNYELIFGYAPLQ